MKKLLPIIVSFIGFLFTLYLSCTASIFSYGPKLPWYIRMPQELAATVIDFTSSLIYENFLITDEEILERKLKKSMIALDGLSTAITRFHEINHRILTNIDELEPIIKEEYSIISTSKNKILDYKDYLHRKIYDEFGQKFYVDTQNYEVYCNNPDVIKKIYNKLQSKKEYRLSYISSRVLYDCIYIEKLKRQFLAKEKRLPVNIKELKIDLPYESWGMKYELDNNAGEIIITFPDGKSNKFRCKSLNIY